MDIPSLFSYGFIVRGLVAGSVVAVIAPLIGMFLVLRRYSLIADTLAHVSLAGVALGAFLGISPIFSAIGVTLVASLGIERLRSSQKIYGESALALFLSGSLAIAIILLGLAHGFTASLFNYLFGSIVTVTTTDIYLIIGLAVLVIAVLIAFYKELVYITFDEEAARVGGIPTKFINIVLMLLSALTVSLAIPIVGVLLIASLIVIPVVTALQLRLSFTKTIVVAEIISIFSVLAGIIISFYVNLVSGGVIVLLMLLIFLGVLMFRR